MFFTGGSAIGEQPVCPDNISGQTGIFFDHVLRIWCFADSV